jgi:alpha-beta hydrolase superfamily lysophospholipase
MTPFHFGPAQAQLFGVYTPPRASVAREEGILLCAPIGLEYMRTHYAVKLLAMQLAASGFHVLRFDYHGTGDSFGEVGAGQFGIWADDVVLAMRELVALSGARSLTIVGLRMGAVLAIEALVSHGLKIHGLVLWEPVVNGPEYLAMLEGIQGKLADQREIPPRQTNDLLGATYPADLRARIEGVDLAGQMRLLDAQGAALVVSEDKPEFDSLLKGMRYRWPDAMYRSMADPIEWGTVKAAFDARMTGPIVRAVAEAAESLT